MRPLTLNQALGQPDVLDAGHQLLIFDKLPTVLLGMRGTPEDFSVKCFGFEPPPPTLGQIRVPLFNYIRSFRGTRDIGSRFSISVFEVVGSSSLSILNDWQQTACSEQNDGAGRFADYAVNGTIFSFDPKGLVAYSHRLKGCWPIVVQAPGQQPQSTASVVQVTMSVDSCTYQRGA